MSEQIVSWVQEELSCLPEASSHILPINVINPALNTRIAEDTTSRIQVSILRNPLSDESRTEASLPPPKASPVVGLAETLNALHSAAKNKARTCVIVVRAEEEPSGEAATKCRVSDAGKALRQLALFAMEYGGVFVGSARFTTSIPECPSSEIALDTESKAAAQRVLREAFQFQGPSLVLLNSDCCYRWLPETEDGNQSAKKSDTIEQFCESQFSWDENEDIRKPPALTRFLDSREQVHLLLSSKPELADEFVSRLPESSELWQKYHRRLLVASEAPDPSAEIRRLLILFGSDAGHAEGLARKLAKEAKDRGVQQCLCSPLDSITDIGSSLQELRKQEAPLIDGAVAVIVSTAGQGEFPGNAKKFWTRLGSGDQTSTALEGVRYGVFGLGDSKYWPKDPEYFGKPSKILDARFQELGGVRVVEMGLGDDQDSGKYEAAWRRWAPQFWDSLGWVKTGNKEEEGEQIEEEIPTDEAIKMAANHLRGTLKRTLDDITTGQVPYTDQKTIKFHGIYQQDHREYRTERAALGLEPFYSFMARVRLPGGLCAPAQWLAMDNLSTMYGDKTMKVTTRQTFQLHGLLKRNLKKSLQEMNKACMDTIAACGDVNRNVLATSTPGLCSQQTYNLIQDYARQLSEFTLPQTSAYHEIFLERCDGTFPDSTPLNRSKAQKIKVGGSYFMQQGACPKNLDTALTDDAEEPLYGAVYLPRKFKVAVAIPPVNDVDVFAHCVGFIADIGPRENPQLGESLDVLKGFTVTVGGGMGRTHNDDTTYPRLGDPIGYCLPHETTFVLVGIMALQRMAGDRQNRRHARFKYTVEDLGLDEVRKRIIELSGVELQQPRVFNFTTRGDICGWMPDNEGFLHYGLFIEGGRVIDQEERKLKTCLREIAQINKFHFRLTCNQNLIISNVDSQTKILIDAILAKYNCAKEDYSALRQGSIACVALPTCPLAFAESERYLPSLLTKVEQLMEESGIGGQDILMRMTGCPNGCARPYASEVGLVGRSLGFYDLYLGGDWVGRRLARKYMEGIDEATILDILKRTFRAFADQRKEGDRFGDFCFDHLKLAGFPN